VSRAMIVLAYPRDRAKAARWISSAPVNTRVTFAEPKRSTDQNAAMWAALTEIATQLRWHGLKLSPDDWKVLMMDALNREARMVPNIDGNGLVNLGRSSSDLSRQEFSDLLEIIHAFAAQHGVQLSTPERTETGQPAPVNA
jgi:hypothetical protein